MTPQWLAGRSTAYLQSDAGPTQNASCGEVVMLSWNPIHSEIFYTYFTIYNCAHDSDFSQKKDLMVVSNISLGSGSFQA